MTYSRTTCDGSSTMRMAGVGGLTWAGAPNQACTLTISIYFLVVWCPYRLASFTVLLPRASAAQWACQALHDDVFSRINLILMSDLRGLCEEASEAVEGADVLTVVTLSFLEAALGKKHSLQVRPIPCTFPLPDQPKPITHGCVMQCLWHTMACAGAAEVVSIAISHQLMASATTSGLPAEAIERY